MENKDFDLKMRWYWFFTYVIIPISLIGTLYLLFNVSSTTSFFNVGGALICGIALMINLVNKKDGISSLFVYYFGLSMVHSSIQLFLVSYLLNQSAKVALIITLVSLIVNILIFFWPNYVYLKRREQFFTN